MLIFLLLIFIFLSSEVGEASISVDKNTIKIGVILDTNSRMGKEQKTSMEIGVETFNNGGIIVKKHKISLTFMEYNDSHLLQAVFSAQKLVEEKKIQVIIIGLDNWQATSLLAQVGSQSKVPTFSLVASPSITPPFPYSLQWPFLVQMAHDGSRQAHNIASFIHAYLWRRVIVVYEANPNGRDDTAGTLALLVEALQKVGSQIEHHIVLPALTSTSIINPETAVQEAFSEFLHEECYSRVFVVLKVSPTYVSHLFKEAKQLGLMGNDSAWIMTEEVTSLVSCCLDTPTVLSMEGALGLMTKFDKSTISFQVFNSRIWVKFSQEYPKEKNGEPGFYALLAYDAITTITTALTSLEKTSTTLNQSHFVNEILRSNFRGLSGHIYFDHDKNMLVENRNTKIVNIVGGIYEEIFDFASEDIEDDTIAKNLAMKTVTWPGNFKGGVPKGWVMPTQDKPMRIGVPVAHIYKNFIYYHSEAKNKGNISRQNEEYNGFCAELFREVLKILGYDLPYKFFPYYGTYDDLIHLVNNKTFDAIVGDVTILENRTELVEFTLPYLESALSIVIPATEPYNSHAPWIFLRPFTLGMWLLTFLLLVYTMFVVWFLEHKHNEDFSGSWTCQLSTAIWFTFSSLFFAQREKVSSNLARVVVVTWMFIVLILTQSYTANLTSMLTIDKLNKSTIDIVMLKRSNAKVGYDNPSFVKRFLEDLFYFDANNIVGIESKFEEFHREFQVGNITAAFLEVIYAQMFISQYCNQYTITTPRYRYGGLAFVFPKGSPVATDVSEAILNLTEIGKVKELETKWLIAGSECYTNIDDFAANINSNGDQDSNSLGFKSFWTLFAFSTGITTLCFLAFVLIPSFKSRVAPTQENVPSTPP